MKVIQKKLPSGLRVVMMPQKDAATATVLVLVGTGSKYESAKENGLSHFLEHMFFKGTARRPSAKIIAEDFDKLGALSNAFTEREYTGYYAKGNPAHTEKFIDILADIYEHSTFPEGEFSKEKGVVIEEINMYEDMPQWKVGENLIALMYGAQPAGKTIIGTKETVASFTRGVLLLYRDKHYTATNTIVVLAGAVDPKKALSQVQKYFGEISRHTPVAKKKTTDTQKSPQVTVFYKKTDQAHIALGFRSVAMDHPDRTALTLLAALLGGGMSSRLFLHLREELGAAYYTSADQELFTDHGIFAITAGIDKGRFTEIMKSIVIELIKVKTELVPPDELKKVKEQAIGMMRLGLESSDNIAGFYGTQLLLRGYYQSPEEMTAAFKKITVLDIQRVAKKYLVAKHANLSVVGPFKEGSISTDFLEKL